ncbi:M66 family metalloprotease [Chondromyces apiculatus]|uniref:Uncharacterized protein n=1 Tax=Chondromyces apiculatus DSM 436 TaxID=1192034 RepID=A0A017TBV1_9BACT|nr:M66 family metalloprotease [Chondromyces apiculatus]EYF06051.1 Hypothetical protein CAP_2241 [Chondromyces apiculatus DSM 436]
MVLRPSRRLYALLAALTSGAFACNALTGADDLTIRDLDGATGAGGTTVSSTGTNMGTGAGSSGTVIVDPTPMVGAAGVNVREISLYQGVKRPLMENGVASTSTLPVVFGRDALIRVFYDTDAGYNGDPVTARLYLDGRSTLQVVQPLLQSSVETNLGSTINFELTADLVLGATSYRVELLQLPADSPIDNPAAKYPAAGFDPIPIDESPAVLRIEIVPVTYSADGSDRVPDTSPAQLRRYQDYFYAMYPVTSVDVVLHEPMPWSGAISPNGGGWGEVLDGLASYRQQEGAPDTTYYYGIFNPLPDVGQFCGGGCVAGLGFLPSPGDTYGRVAVGLGYPENNLDIETAVHEIGHAHGRPHSPCGGAGDPDPAFPYADGGIGTWGYNIVSKQLYDPTSFTDLMGYCVPIWISDYSFRQIHERVQFIDGVRMVFPPESLGLTYDRVHIGIDGHGTFLEPVTLQRPPIAQATQVDVQTANGIQAVTAQFYRYDHIEGGLLLWPRTSNAAITARAHLPDGLVQAVR